MSRFVNQHTHSRLRKPVFPLPLAAKWSSFGYSFTLNAHISETFCSHKMVRAPCSQHTGCFRFRLIASSQFSCFPQSSHLFASFPCNSSLSGSPSLSDSPASLVSSARLCAHHLHHAVALIIFIALSHSSSSSCCRAHHFLCAAALIIFIAPPHSSSSSPRRAYHLHCTVALNFNFALLRSSSLLRCCDHLIIAPLIFCPLAHLQCRVRSELIFIFFFALLRPHLHCRACHAPIFMAPVTRPSSLSRPSRAHLHCCTHRVLIFMLRLLHARLHHRAHCPPIFFIFAPLRPYSSSLLRCCS